MLAQFRAALAAIALLAVAGTAHAAPTTCPQLFVGGQAPDLKSQNLAVKARPLCFGTFAVLHSGLTRTPLYSAEHLTAAVVEASRGQSRQGIQFHEEDQLPQDERAWLSDYRHQEGIDRGHLANWADSADPATFTLANIVPQNSDNNRNLWEWIEGTTRTLTLHQGEVYVVSGPIFQGEHITFLNNRVAVPTGLYKAIFVPSTGQAGVYVVDNKPGVEWKALSVSQLRDLIGIDVFPSLPEPVKAQLMELPQPRPRGRSAALIRQRRERDASSTVDDVLGFVSSLVK